MPLKYLSYYDPDCDELRDLLVVDGLPYYRSTGVNSSLPGKWLPFFGIRDADTLPADILFSTRAILSKMGDGFVQASFSDPRAPVGWLIKFRRDAFICETPEIDAEPLSLRIYTKKDLITSVRLSVGENKSVSDKAILVALGLNAAEIEESQIALNLEKMPDKTTSSPKEINAWLLEQGAKTFKPSSHKDLQEEKPGPEKAAVKLISEQIQPSKKNLFSEKIPSDSLSARRKKNLVIACTNTLPHGKEPIAKKAGGQ